MNIKDLENKVSPEIYQQIQRLLAEQKRIDFDATGALSKVAPEEEYMRARPNLPLSDLNVPEDARALTIMLAEQVEEKNTHMAQLKYYKALFEALKLDNLNLQNTLKNKNAHIENLTSFIGDLATNGSGQENEIQKFSKAVMYNERMSLETISEDDYLFKLLDNAFDMLFHFKGSFNEAQFIENMNIFKDYVSFEIFFIKQDTPVDDFFLTLFDNFITDNETFNPTLKEALNEAFDRYVTKWNK